MGRLHADALDHVHAAHPGQPQIDQCDVGLVLAELRDRLHAIRRLAHHVEAFGHPQQGHQSLADNVVVFDNQYTNWLRRHYFNLVSSRASPRAGARNRIVVPSPGALATSSVPPMAAARSFIPVNPK